MGDLMRKSYADQMLELLSPEVRCAVLREVQQMDDRSPEPLQCNNLICEYRLGFGYNDGDICEACHVGEMRPITPAPGGEKKWTT